MKSIILDVETGGFSPEKDMLTQIAAIVVENNRIIDEFNMFCLPQDGYRLTDGAVQVNGHTADFLKQRGKPIQLVMVSFYHFLYKHQVKLKHHNKPLMVAQNVKFDRNFLTYKFNLYLKKEIDPLFRGRFDTVEMFRNLFPDEVSHNLGNIYNKVFDEPLSGAHDAMVDVKATFKILEELSLRATKKSEQNDEIKHWTFP